MTLERTKIIEPSWRFESDGCAYNDCIKTGRGYKYTFSCKGREPTSLSLTSFPCQRYDVVMIVNGERTPIVSGFTSAGQTSVDYDLKYISECDQIEVISDGRFSAHMGYLVQGGITIDNLPESWIYFDQDEDEDPPEKSLEDRISEALKGRPPEPQCECGAKHVRHARHSTWCPVYEEL